MAVIDVDAISVRYGHETILKDVSCQVQVGEFIGLVGPNGAGKSTLLRAVLGLLPVAEGNITTNGAAIGYVPQRGKAYSGNVPISVAEVVGLGAGGATLAASDALSLVRMKEFAGKRFTELSGGQQQRVGIAKALAGGVDVLILDEPTAGIDEQSQAEFYALLRLLHGQGKTLILVSHDVGAVLALVSRVIYLNRTVIYDGLPAGLENKYV